MRWLSIDPGEDLGWALWDEGDLITTGTDKGWQFVVALSAALRGGEALSEYELWGEIDARQFQDVKLLVIEDFALYPEEAHSGRLDWDRLRTVRFIGALELLAVTYGLTLVEQPAKIKHEAIAAGAEELFLSPRTENRHANDAIMHGVRYRVHVTFGQPPEELKRVGGAEGRGGN